MPYALRKVPKKDLYWVVNKETGKKYSKEGLPKERAEAQRRALYAAESGYTMRGGITRAGYTKIIKKGIEKGYVVSMDEDGTPNENGEFGIPTSAENWRKFVKLITDALTPQQRELPEIEHRLKKLRRQYDEGKTVKQTRLADVIDYIIDNAPHGSDTGPPPERQRRGFAEREAAREAAEAAEAERVAREAEQAAEAARALADREAAEAEAAREAARLPPIRVPSQTNTQGSTLSPTAQPARAITEEELAAMRSRTQPKTGKGKVGGGIEMKLLQEMAQSAYRGKTKLQIGPFKLLTSTPTLKFYKDDSPKRIIISVRGTDLSDKVDLAADALAIIGKLRTSERWKRDLAKVKEVQSKFSPREYRYIAVGHSLGGAIIDLMLRDKLVQSALSYNPLVEPQELGGNPKHRRVYHKDDPLYQAFGRFIPNVEVRTTAEPFWKYFLEYNLPFNLGDLFKLYDRHRIGRFKGGSLKGGMTFNDFRRWWVTPLTQNDRDRLAMTGNYDPRAYTYGDTVIHILTTLLGYGATGYGLSVYDRNESNTGVHPAGFPIAAAGFVGSPFIGPLISRLFRLLPMPPTERQERELAELRQREEERRRGTTIRDNPLAPTERTAANVEERQVEENRLATARTYGARNPFAMRNIVPRLPPQERSGDVEIEMTPQRLAEARAAAEAELEAEAAAEQARFPVAVRREFPQLGPADDRDNNGVVDPRAFGDEVVTVENPAAGVGMIGKGRELLFEDQLQELDYSPKKYLSKARSKAKKAGYDPKKLSFCEDGTHKLQYKTPDGKMVHFGRVGYGDFLIWSFLEQNGKVEKGEAKKRRKSYLKRASAIEGDWEDNKYSPNNLAMKILWM